MELVSEEVVVGLLLMGKSYLEISEELQNLYPAITRGLSERSVRRYAKEHNLKEKVEHSKESTIEESVKEVGGLYGRKMLKGYLASKGVAISERKLRNALPRITPQWHLARQQNSHERSNPRLYSANYFGHKLHLDQNEKLVHYGVTYVLARDGFSGKIVGGSVMPRKNNEIIYDTVYRRCVLQNGLWDEIRVDHGKEFYLSLFVQEQLRVGEGRGDQSIAPYVQTSSTHNHIIERIWVEVNQRVTYPIKRIIVEMDNQNLINMECDHEKYCVSSVLRRVCEVGLSRMVEAWNNHSIPRKGIPNVLQMSRNGTTSISSHEVPTLSDAVSGYRLQRGTITEPSEFGEDPLAGNTHLVYEREQTWLQRCGVTSAADIYSGVVSGNSTLLQDARRRR